MPHVALSPTTIAWLASPIATWSITLACFLVGLAACVLLAIVEYGAWVLVLPPRRKPEAGSEWPSDGEPASVVAADGARLAGRWYPTTEPVRPGWIALLLHGFAESSDGIQAERVGLLRRIGWSLLAVDLRGYGDSEGPYASFGGREAGDVSAWLDALEQKVLPREAFTPILWGRSMGAAIALRAAATDSRIKALILESPMIDLDDAMAVWFRNRRFPFSRLLARLVTRRASRIAGVSVTRPNALETAPRVLCPVLIVHGENDSLVPTAQAQCLARAFSTAVDFIPVAGAGHTDVLSIGGGPVLVQIAEFIQRAGARQEPA